MTNKGLSYLNDLHISKHVRITWVGSGWAKIEKKLTPTTYPVSVISGPPSQI